MNMINHLPEKFTLEDEAAIRAALKAYDALDEEQQKLVTNYNKIEDVIIEEVFTVGYDGELSYLYGWPKLKPYSGERGNNVSVDFEFIDSFGTVNELSELKISIFKDDERLATNTLIDTTKHLGKGVSCSFYDGDTSKTSSWYLEKIQGTVGEVIFDSMELKVVKDNTIYIFTSNVMFGIDLM